MAAVYTGQTFAYGHTAPRHEVEPEYPLGDLTPLAERLEVLSARAEDALLDPARVDEAIELRQTCLALAQLACREDAVQLARAASELATAYQRRGHHGAASRHAAHTEGLLLESGQAHPALLAQVLATLACALADGREHVKALECFPPPIFRPTH